MQQSLYVALARSTYSDCCTLISRYHSRASECDTNHAAINRLTGRTLIYSWWLSVSSRSISFRYPSPGRPYKALILIPGGIYTYLVRVLPNNAHPLSGHYILPSNHSLQSAHARYLFWHSTLTSKSVGLSGQNGVFACQMVVWIPVLTSTNFFMLLW